MKTILIFLTLRIQENFNPLKETKILQDIITL
jgi:hypothetical protein